MRRSPVLAAIPDQRRRLDRPLGRGDGTTDDWDELRAEAARAHNKRTASYVLGMPLLPDQLEEALSQLGLSCEDYEIGRS